MLGADKLAIPFHDQGWCLSTEQLPPQPTKGRPGQTHRCQGSHHNANHPDNRSSVAGFERMVRSRPLSVAQVLRGTRVRDAFSGCARFGCPNRLRSSSVAISKFTKVASTSRI
jgi:hypothetical protein